MVNFPTRISDCDCHSPALLDFFLSSDATICSTMAFSGVLQSNSDHVAVSVSIDFPSSSKWNTLFHFIHYEYSRPDWDGLPNHLKDNPWQDIHKLSASPAS